MIAKVLMVLLALTILGGTAWLYHNTDAPSWCHGTLMRYERSCAGWTWAGNNP